MGIRDQKEYQAAAFEPMEGETETTTATTTKDETMTTQTTTQDAGVAATTAIAKAATTAVGAAKKMKIAFAEQQNVFDTDTVEGLSMASPRIKGEQGSLFAGDKDLGSKIRFEIVSWNKRWAIGNGENDSESKEFFRVSLDGQTITTDGTLITDYVDGLKAQGFSKARVSPYLDVWGFVTWSEKVGDIPVDERELSILQCSQTSMGAFVSFCTTRGLLESKGVAQPLSEVDVTAMKRQSGSNKYTNLAFSAPKA